MHNKAIDRRVSNLEASSKRLRVIIHYSDKPMPKHGPDDLIITYRVPKDE